MKRILLVAAKTGYQVREFYGAAERLGVHLVLATDRCHILDDPWSDRAAPVQFAHPQGAMEALKQRGPFDGIVAVGDQPAYVAAEIAACLGLHFHSPQSVRAANDKFRTRERFRAAGMLVPAYSLYSANEPKYPCVLKPLHLSASRGVIRANNTREFEEALARVRKITRGEAVLVEDFIPGSEFALEGIVTAGCLQTLAIFDKPDPLDGPYFEETIYVTPSRETGAIQQAIHAAAQQAVNALGLSHGPVHAEMRVNSRGVWMLEAAARPIGGLCARVLKFCGPGCQPAADCQSASSGLVGNAPLSDRPYNEISLEELLLLHAVGEHPAHISLTPDAHGVMMIPIPESGIFQRASGQESASRVPGITAVEITAKEGQKLEALPEGASYLGFLFARCSTPERAEQALRSAHACLHFQMNQALPVVK
ncbi:MAG: ATP-grasp domain-containing protein [Bryobacterales bacterium]|nr:ATP-grasp domain-containing protein [Bryobacterales bacterium]MBV9396660.1 ATP-grasp domain-containing protein [Bryobacterales bacterium]